MEEWKQIEIDGEKINYEVSTEGRVRNKHGRILSLNDNGYGYLQVKLYFKGRQWGKKVHKLVATAFIPNPYNLTDVNHINENKHDNRVENLEWLSHKNNVVYSKAKKVKCVETGEIFESANDASRKMSIGLGYLCDHLNGKWEKCKGFHFEYVD